MNQAEKSSLRKWAGLGILAGLLLVGVFGVAGGAPVSANSARPAQPWRVYLPLILTNYNAGQAPTPTASPTRTPTSTPTQTPSPTRTPTITSSPTPTLIEFYALFPGQVHITDGIILFAVIIVAIIILGVIWGGGLKVRRRGAKRK
jgi:hypothetical protein